MQGWEDHIAMDFDAGNSETGMKKTLGKRRIPIQKIENKQSRKVCFSKRRAGLFKKASELSTLCGSEIAVIVFSESGKAFSFGHPNAESVLHRYVAGSGAQSASNGIRNFGNSEEVVRWENRIGVMGLDELQLYANCLQKVRNVVSVKAASMASTSGYQNCVAESDHGNQKFVQDNCYNEVKCEPVSDQGNQNSTNGDLLLQDICSDDLKLELVSDQGNWNSSSDVLNVQEKSCIDDVNWEPETDQGNQKSSSDDRNVQESCFDDVNWEDIATYMAKSPVISSYESMGFGKVELPGSSSCFEVVDTEFERSMRGIQWEKEEDGFGLFGSSLPGLLSS